MDVPAWAQRGSAMSSPSTGPAKGGLVLTALVLGATVCNLNLSVANIALPDIGRTFNAAQTQVNLVALGCTLGLAMSVLYLGALGDRFGRKALLMLGMGLTIPVSLFSAFAPSANLLVAGRLLTGVAAGMAYPTTLALITALWSEGPKRVRAIALWSGISGGGAVLGPILAGLLLENFWWGSVFLIAIPPALVAFLLVWRLVPGHVNESTEAVDHRSGVLSVFTIALLVLGIGTVSAPGMLPFAIGLLVISLLLALVFARRQMRIANPLYDLHYARRQLFWVPAIAGMIVFGSLMGAMFIGQQYMQNVLGYSTLAAGLAILPSAIGMIGIAPLSGKLIVERGSRFTLLLGYCFIFPAFMVMLFGWRVGTSYPLIGLAYFLVGAGVGLALAPASRSLTGSVPVRRVGMASGTADLQRDLGGSVMQALLGSLLTAGYATAFARMVAGSSEASQVSEQTQAALLQSYSSAENLATQYPDYQEQIITAARESFLAGANWAYAAGAVAVLIGVALVIARFPGKAGEQRLLDEYAAADA